MCNFGYDDMAAESVCSGSDDDKRRWNDEADGYGVTGGSVRRQL